MNTLASTMIAALETTSAAIEGGANHVPVGLVTPPIEIGLGVLLLVVTFFIIKSRNLFTTVILAGVFSLLCTGIYTLVDAVDVAFTEAAVGAGVSTVLFLATLSLTGEREAARGSRPWLAVGACVLMGAALLYGTAHMPAYGDYSAAINHHVVPRYITESPVEIGLPNFVTSVLASYRGFDTFGETTVVFTASVGVLILLRSNWSLAGSGAPGPSQVATLTDALKPRSRTKPSSVRVSQFTKKADQRDAHSVPEYRPTEEDEAS
jgi:multicomponent Na+:H+ antiporter subunit B